MSDTTTWLGAARIQLTQARVATPVADEILARAEALIEESGEGPEELFGDPRTWADDQIAERRDAGLALAAPDPDTNWRDVPVLGFGSAAVVTSVFMVLALVRGESPMDFHLPAVLAPVVFGFVPVLGLTTWEMVLSRKPVAVAILAGGGVLAGGVGLVALLMWATHDVVLGHGSAWWYLPVIAACAIAAGVLQRVLPEASRRA